MNEVNDNTNNKEDNDINVSSACLYRSKLRNISKIKNIIQDKLEKLNDKSSKYNNIINDYINLKNKYFNSKIVISTSLKSIISNLDKIKSSIGDNEFDEVNKKHINKEELLEENKELKLKITQLDDFIKSKKVPIKNYVKKISNDSIINKIKSSNKQLFINCENENYIRRYENNIFKENIGKFKNKINDFSIDKNNNVLICSDSEPCKLFKVSNSKYIFELKGNKKNINCCTFFNNEFKCLTGGNEHIIRCYDLNKVEVLESFTTERTPLCFDVFQEDNKFISGHKTGDFTNYFVKDSSSIFLWDLKQKNPIGKIQAPYWVNCINIIDDYTIIYLYDGPIIQKADLRKLSDSNPENYIIKTVNTNYEIISKDSDSCMTVNSRKDYLAISSKISGKIVIFSTNEMDMINTFDNSINDGINIGVQSICWDEEDNNTLYCGDVNGYMSIWDVNL